MKQKRGSFSFGKKVLIAIGAVLFAFFLLNSWALTKIVCYRFFDPGMTPYMEKEAERLKKVKPNLRFKAYWTDGAKISRHMQCAAILSEDWYFYSHRGVD